VGYSRNSPQAASSPAACDRQRARLHTPAYAHMLRRQPGAVYEGSRHGGTQNDGGCLAIRSLPIPTMEFGGDGCWKLQTPHASRRQPALVSVDHETAVLGLAAPPRQPVPGPGRPRTQVEPGSLGSGRPPSLSRRAGDADAAGPAPPELTTAEWAALQQLADASTSVVSRWHVGRAVALSLTRRSLVRSCSEWVWLTEAGRQALSAAPTRQPIQPPGPELAGTPDRTVRPAERGSRSGRSDHQAPRQPQETVPVGRAASGELPRGVLLRDP
jgi:hypothetical protein